MVRALVVLPKGPFVQRDLSTWPKNARTVEVAGARGWERIVGHSERALFSAISIQCRPDYTSEAGFRPGVRSLPTRGA